MNFGDPSQVRVVPPQKKSGGFFSSLFGGKSEPTFDEHPASVNFAPELAKQLSKSHDLIAWRDERGWSLLHHHSLAGNSLLVQVLLDHGADASARTNDGVTPLQLAHVLGWEKVVGQLMAKSGRA